MWIRATRTTTGRQTIFNSNNLTCIEDHDGIGCFISFTDKTSILIDESFDSITKLIKPNTPSIQMSEISDKIPVETSIDDLSFSVRATNVLKRIGAKTLEDVITAFAHEGNYARIRGCGRKTAEEIVGKVNACGYHFVWE